MPRRVGTTSDDGATLSLATMPPPPLASAVFRGGPLDGAVLPVRTTVRGWPAHVRWAAAGAWWIYRLDRRCYAIDAVGGAVPEVHDPYRHCSTCGATNASPDLRGWLCIAAECGTKVHTVG